MSVTAAAIAGGTALAGAGASAIAQGKMNKRSERMTREAWARDERLLSDQRAYENPAAQMARLQEAGLNPNLMYGQGSTGSSATAPASKTMEFKNPLQGMDAGSAFSLYQNMKQSNAQISVQEKQAALMDQELQNKLLDNVMKSYNVQREAERSFYYQTDATSESQRKSNLASYQSQRYQREAFEAQRSGLGLMKDQSTLKDVIDTAHWVARDAKQRALRGEIDNSFNRELKPFGMTSTDPLWQRKLVPILESILSRSLSKGKANNLYQLRDLFF